MSIDSASRPSASGATIICGPSTQRAVWPAAERSEWGAPVVTVSSRGPKATGSRVPEAGGKASQTMAVVTRAGLGGGVDLISVAARERIADESALLRRARRRRDALREPERLLRTNEGRPPHDDASPYVDKATPSQSPTQQGGDVISNVAP